MRTATFLAFFLASSAMFCSAASTAPLNKLPLPKAIVPLPTAAFDATVDFLVKEHSDIVIKAYADVCSDADISSAISTNLRVQVSGLISVDFGLGTKLSSALKTSIKSAVKSEVDAEIKSEFTANLKVNIGNIITKRCPKKDAACIKAQSKNIVSDAAKLTVKSSAKITSKIQANLSTKVKAAVDLQVKKFSVNLLLVKISVSGDVDVCGDLSLKFKAAAGLCAQACLDVQAKEASQIKTICSA